MSGELIEARIVFIPSNEVLFHEVTTIALLMKEIKFLSRMFPKRDLSVKILRRIVNKELN